MIRRVPQLVEHFRRARRDPSLVVLEGFHAIKHASRFGAELVEVATDDAEGLRQLVAALAPDLDALVSRATLVPSAGLAEMALRPPRTGILATARRPQDGLTALRAPAEGRVILLEDPRRMGNVGACIRVAAAAGARAVVTTGAVDPWHAEAVRGSAGLHFAQPVVRVDDAASIPGPGPLIAFDPDGDQLPLGALARTAVLAFGTERSGLSPALLSRADLRVRIPMREGVSSLNLATSVAAALYAMS